jgi:Fe-coproporphyrin III synthase
MTLSSYNADQYNKAFAAAKAECPWLKPGDFHMNIAHESAHYYGNAEGGVLNKNTTQIIEEVRRYRALRGYPHSPIDFIERRYLKYVEQYLHTGKTPMRCHALRSSCFIDPFGDVYPCSMYDAKIANIREFDYDLNAIWKMQKTRGLQKDIWEYKCPQCWTPCEAYQSVFGNLLGNHNTALNKAISIRKL